MTPRAGSSQWAQKKNHMIGGRSHGITSTTNIQPCHSGIFQKTLHPKSQKWTPPRILGEPSDPTKNQAQPSRLGGLNADLFVVFPWKVLLGESDSHHFSCLAFCSILGGWISPFFLPKTIKNQQSKNLKQSLDHSISSWLV